MSLGTKFKNPRIWMPLLAIGVLLIVWYPIFHNQFLMWDDDFNIYDNPILREGSWTEFWLKPYMGFYIPLTYTIWFGIAQVFTQTDPVPFKILNLAFHALNTILIFGLMRFLYDEFLRAKNDNRDSDQRRDLLCFLASLLYLVHPMQVGAVAWHSGFRDLLSTFGTLSCLLILFRFKGWGSWLLAAGAFAIALMSKPSSVYLPGVIMGLSFVLGRELRFRLMSFSVIWLGLAFVFIEATKRIQSQFMIGLTPAPWENRPFLIMDSYGFYLRQFFGMGQLSADYGRTPDRVMDWGLWMDTLPWFWGFLILLALLFYHNRRAGWVFLCLWVVPLSPTSGLVHFNFQRISTVADHYIQPALPAFCFLLIYVLHRWAKKPVLAAAVLAVVAWGAVAHARIAVWHDSESFFHSMLKVTPYSHSANNYLGYFAYRRQDWPEAEKFFRMALASQPSSGIASGNLAYSLIKQNRFEEAVAVLRDKFRDPVFFKDNEVHRHVIAMNYLANSLALANLLQFGPALESVCQVFKFNPEPRDQNDATATFHKLQQELNPKDPKAVLCPE